MLIKQKANKAYKRKKKHNPRNVRISKKVRKYINIYRLLMCDLNRYYYQWRKIMTCNCIITYNNYWSKHQQPQYMKKNAV